MPKLALFTFSGTGNTQLVASMLTHAFEELGIGAGNHSIEDILKRGVFPDISECETVGIGYPVYAFNTPSNVNRFVKMFPPADGKKVFIYKTAGEPFYWNNSSSARIVRLLKRKGYTVFFERHFLMPYNIMFRYPDALVKQMHTTSQRMAEDMARRIINGESCPPKLTLQSLAAAVVFRIQWPGAALNGRLYSTGKSCNLCGKCVKNCPTGSIRIKNGRVKFGWKCIMCMRCVMNCPQQALRIGILQPWALHGNYEYERILNDESIPSVYVGADTKGYFKLFRKYYQKVERTINNK